MAAHVEWVGRVVDIKHRQGADGQTTVITEELRRPWDNKPHTEKTEHMTAPVEGPGTRVVHAERRDVMNAPPSRGGLLRPVAAIQEIMAAQDEMHEVIKQGLKKNRDYGPMPGAFRAQNDDGTPKEAERNVLWKAGAERVMQIFGAAARYEIVEGQIDHDVVIPWKKRKKEWSGSKGNRRYEWKDTEGTSLGLYRYVVRAFIYIKSTGEVIAEGIGVCSTLESKYVDRPRDSENTVLKMAQKRALTAGVLNGFALSDRFTQDIDEAADDDEEAETGPTQRASASETPKTPEIFDDRGIALMPFGPEGVKGMPIDNDAVSVTLLTEGIEWVLKLPNDDERKVRCAPLVRQGVAALIAKIPTAPPDKLAKAMRFISNDAERRKFFDAFVLAADEYGAKQQQDRVADESQTVESVAAVDSQFADDVFETMEDADRAGALDKAD
jgi:hypothetical protein